MYLQHVFMPLQLANSGADQSCELGQWFLKWSQVVLEPIQHSNKCMVQSPYLSLLNLSSMSQNFHLNFQLRWSDVNHYRNASTDTQRSSYKFLKGKNLIIFKLCMLVQWITLETIRYLSRFLNHSDVSALKILIDMTKLFRSFSYFFLLLKLQVTVLDTNKIIHIKSNFLINIVSSAYKRLVLKYRQHMHRQYIDSNKCHLNLKGWWLLF